MTLWIARYGVRMLAILMVMLVVEFASFYFALEGGINRIYWVPLSFALVAYGGYDTVRRMPLIWGVVVGAALAGSTSMLSLAIGTLLLEGKFRLPTEVDPLLLFTTLLMTSLLGAIVGGAAGVMARASRRDRARRTAIRKLSYMATDDAGDAVVEPPADGDAPVSALDPSLSRTAESL